MRFRFCGGLDAPEWLLSEISILSRLSPECMATLTQQVLVKLMTGAIDYVKLQESINSSLSLVSDVKAAVAAIDFVLTSGAKYDVEGKVLALELQQLGLAREGSDAVVAQFLRRKDELRASLHSRSLRLARVESLDWRVDCTLASSETGPITQPVVHVSLNVVQPAVGEQGTSEASQIKMAMTPDKFRVFFAELKAAQTLLDAVA